MKFVLVSMLATTAVMFTGGATAATEMPPLAKKYHCTNCHDINVKMIGPSWTEVSKAYNSNGKTGIGKPVSEILQSKNAEEWLKHKISHGGAGIWGTVLMPSFDPGDTWKTAKMDKLVKQIMGVAKGDTAKDDLLKSSEDFRCAACHDMDTQGIGPSWMDIANVYNNNGTTPYGVKVSDILKKKTPEEWLMLKVSHGGLGNWGGMLMPAMEYVVKPGSLDGTIDETQRTNDLKELTTFIMGLAKK